MSDVHDPKLRHVVGLDLGKQTDPSALVLLEWRVPDPAPQIGSYGFVQVKRTPQPSRRPVYAVPTIKRWPIGTPYKQITEGVIRFLQTPLLTQSRALLALDASGVGNAVAEMLRERFILAGLTGGMVMVTITPGNAVTNVAPGEWHVSKRVLASLMLALLSSRRLNVTSEAPEATTLRKELESFSSKIAPATANETYEAVRGAHDDTVLATAIACWAAETIHWPPPKLPAQSRGLRV